MIRCEGLSYRYPFSHAPVLRELDFTIATGDFVLLAGASGSGKSTLCRLFNGLIPHLHGGEVRGQLAVAGYNPHITPPHQLSQVVGLLLQRPDSQCLATTVARDIAFGPACQGHDRATIRQRVRETAEWLDITHLLERSPHTLSGGEQQHVALAGVLALQPRLLILDEPFAFLDATGASRLRALLKRLHTAGITLVVAEHRLELITDVANRMLVLDQGRLVADTRPIALMANDVVGWGLEAPGMQNTPPAAHSVKAPGPPVIEWDNVWCERQGQAVLLGASLQSTAGDIVGLLGANGAGKSTLLRHGNGLLRAQGGQVRVQGQAIGRRSVAEIAREVGFVIQQPARMLFAPTVRAELDAGPQALQRHDAAWCLQLVERFRLGPLLDRPPHLLSAGEQRRVAIAAILAARPQALLLDEPTAGQDARALIMLRTLLNDCADEGVAITVATHHQAWAAALCQRWAILAEGRIVLDTTPTMALAQTEVLYRARLLTHP